MDVLIGLVLLGDDAVLKAVEVQVVFDLLSCSGICSDSAAYAAALQAAPHLPEALIAHLRLLVDVKPYL